MDVKLYVYDLSRGMARSMSRSLLGIQIDAVYHTSIVWNGVETFFGQGIQQTRPGATHHGQPMEIVDLGQTQLPPDVVLDYLESLKPIYTPEAYDLFQNNCNNFSNDLAQFLVGKGIPDHITSLPKTVLDTPFGQMLKPQLDASMRSITQAPVPSSSLPSPTHNGAIPNGVNGSATKPAPIGEHGTVYNVTEATQFDKLLAAAKTSCATIFFTSSTCAPCKLAYPTFDSLAAENPRAVFIKVDTNYAPALASRYQIRATPTFLTYLRGSKMDQWSGASPPQLRANVSNLVAQAFPAHRHSTLDVPTLRLGSLRPVTYTKIPPLDKLLGKLGPTAESPVVKSMQSFILARSAAGAKPASVALPDLKPCAAYLRSAPTAIPPESLFALVDLFRCTVLDTRASGWFAADAPDSVTSLLQHIASLEPIPYALRLVSLQLTATLFSSHLWLPIFLPSQDVLSFTTAALLQSDAPPALRGAAASLAFNLAAANYRARRESPDSPEPLPASAQVELLAALAELFSVEPTAGSKEGGHASLAAMGLLVYYADEAGEIDELCTALGVKETITNVKTEGKAEESRKDLLAVLPG